MNSAPEGRKSSLLGPMIGALGAILAAIVATVLAAKLNRDFKAYRADLGGSEGTWRIQGQVRKAAGRQARYTVFLVPGNRMTATTDDEGNFSLDAVPAGYYQVLIRDDALTTTSSSIGPGKAKGTMTLKGAEAEWSIADADTPQKKTASAPPGLIGSAVALAATTNDVVGVPRPDSGKP